MHWRPAVTLFVALWALYSPLAALSSYFPVVKPLSPGDRAKLSFGLFCYVLMGALLALWVGEPLLELLGMTTDALTVTGGIALMYAAIPIMRGTAEEPEPPLKETADDLERAAAEKQSAATPSWKSMLFMPTFFPLTFGGTTFAFFVAARAEARGVLDAVPLTIAGAIYAAVTGVTLYASGRLERRVSPGARMFLERVAGILLVAIAAMLLLGGGTRMVMSTMQAAQK